MPGFLVTGIASPKEKSTTDAEGAFLLMFFILTTTNSQHTGKKNKNKRTSVSTSLQIYLKEKKNMFILAKKNAGLPVIRDSSTIECPSITRPSTGNLPPGTTLTMSPRWTSSTSTCSSLEFLNKRLLTNLTQAKTVVTIRKA